MKQCYFCYIIFIFLLIVSLYSCQYSNEPVQKISNAESIVLEWDPPQPAILVRSYRIYYRKDNSVHWILLDEISASENPHYTIHHSDLGNGLYEFAVKALNKFGQSSELHTSRDQNAIPMNGWYLFWMRSE